MAQKVTKGSQCLGITQNFDNLHTKQELTRPEFGLSKIFVRKAFRVWGRRVKYEGRKVRAGTDKCRIKNSSVK